MVNIDDKMMQLTGVKDSIPPMVEQWLAPVQQPQSRGGRNGRRRMDGWNLSSQWFGLRSRVQVWQFPGLLCTEGRKASSEWPALCWSLYLPNLVHVLTESKLINPLFMKVVTMVRRLCALLKQFYSGCSVIEA